MASRTDVNLIDTAGPYFINANGPGRPMAGMRHCDGKRMALDSPFSFLRQGIGPRGDHFH